MSSRAPYEANVQQEIHSLKARLDFKVAWILRIIVPMQFIHCCCFYPACACAARGYVISRGVCPVVVSINLQFFWNQSFISQNTHFQRSILTHIGFSSNLMASGTA